MIELRDSVYIPNVGGYNPGDQADLGETLETQLVRCGKAKWILNDPVDKLNWGMKHPEDIIVHPTKGIEPSLTDD